MVEQESALRRRKKSSSIIWPILIGLAWRDFGWRADALTLSLFHAFNRNCWQAVAITVCCRPICPLHFAGYQHGEWPVERLSFACCCCFCEGRWLKLTGWDAVLSVQEWRLWSGAVVFSSVVSFCLSLWLDLDNPVFSACSTTPSQGSLSRRLHSLHPWWCLLSNGVNIKCCICNWLAAGHWLSCVSVIH